MTWRTIDTAPKDKSQKQLLLGFSPEAGIRIMRYDGWGQGTGGFEYEGQFADGYGGWNSFAPTHWMPLPDPPAVEERTAKFTPQQAQRGSQTDQS